MNCMIEKSSNLIVQWVGDISLNEQLCNPQYHQAIRKSMAKLAHEGGACDLRVGNFEAPIWGDGGVNELKEPRICTTKQAAKCILPLKLDVVFLGNNHVYDCRETGFQNTIEFLQENNIKFLGAGKSQQEASQPLILERKGISLGFLNYVHRNTNPNVPSEAGVFLNYFDERVALDEIANMSHKVDVLLLYLHWGEKELVRLPSLAKRRFGRGAIEAGATVAVFDHAHCLRPHEKWHTGHVCYGLGNFVFGNVLGKQWPALAHRTAMVTMEVHRGHVEGVRFSYMCQKDGMPIWDDRKSRFRSHKRLNYCLRFSDRTYALLYKWEEFYQLHIVTCLLFIRRSGGIIPALFRIRMRHFSKSWRALSSLLGRTG